MSFPVRDREREIEMAMSKRGRRMEYLYKVYRGSFVIINFLPIYNLL